MKGVTKRQKEILDYIQEFIDAFEYSPSYREIMQKFGFSSLGSVHKHLRTLQRKGLLEAEKSCSRSLNPVQATKPPNFGETEVKLPFIGHIIAGKPIETFPQMQTVAVPHFLVPSTAQTYVLRAKGDSLQEERIMDGDLLIIEARREAHPGETVVVLLNQRETYIKKYYPEENNVRLESSSSLKKSLTLSFDDFLIQGVLTGLLRIY